MKQKSRTSLRWDKVEAPRLHLHSISLISLEQHNPSDIFLHIFTYASFALCGHILLHFILPCLLTKLKNELWFPWYIWGKKETRSQLSIERTLKETKHRELIVVAVSNTPSISKYKTFFACWLGLQKRLIFWYRGSTN